MTHLEIENIIICVRLMDGDTKNCTSKYLILCECNKWQYVSFPENKLHVSSFYWRKLNGDDMNICSE